MQLVHARAGSGLRGVKRSVLHRRSAPRPSTQLPDSAPPLSRRSPNSKTQSRPLGASRNRDSMRGGKQVHQGPNSGMGRPRTLLVTALTFVVVDSRRKRLSHRPRKPRRPYAPSTWSSMSEAWARNWKRSQKSGTTGCRKISRRPRSVSSTAR